MPLVRIDIPASLPAGHWAPAIGQSVHQAMIETIGVPPDDRFQIIATHASAGLVIDPHFPGVTRPAAPFIIHITLRAGRTDAQKRALYAGIEARLVSAGLPPDSAMIVLAENTSPDWSFAGGVAANARAEP